MASTNRPSTKVHRPQNPLTRVRHDAADLHGKLTHLDAVDLPALFFPIGFDKDPEVPVAGRYTRQHGLGDADAFLATLAELQCLPLHRSSKLAAAPQAGGTCEITHRGPPAAEVHNAAVALRPEVAQTCAKAGMASDKAAKACHSVVRTVADKIYACRDRRFGKSRQREFSAIIAAAERLLAALPLLRRWALTEAQARRSALVLHRVGCLLTMLEKALPRVVHNATRKRDSVDLGTPGGATVPDAVTFGAECMVAIWRTHHTTQPTLSRNRGGFLEFGETLLHLAVKVQGAGPPAWIQRTTFETALRQQVILIRTRDNAHLTEKEM